MKVIKIKHIITAFESFKNNGTFCFSRDLKVGSYLISFANKEDPGGLNNVYHPEFVRIYFLKGDLIYDYSFKIIVFFIMQYSSKLF